MAIIGRRLTVPFSPHLYISLEKRFVAPELFRGNFEDHKEDAFLEEINAVMGSEYYRYLGKPADYRYGRDVNAIISQNGNWVTNEEWDNLSER